MKRKIGLLLIGTLVMSMLSGCGADSDVNVTADGSFTYSVNYYLTELELQNCIEEGYLTQEDVIGTKDVNGQLYYSIDGESSMSDSGVIITPEKYYVKISSGQADTSASLFDLDFVTTSVTMPDEVVKTNGVISEDKKTITWDILNNDYDVIYAYTSENPQTNTIKLNTGSGKYVKAKKACKFTSKDELKYVEFNNSFSSQQNNVYINDIQFADNSVSFAKTGTYTFYVWSTTNCQKFTVKVDGTNPEIKGVANNKTYKKPVTITFGDKHSGIKTATLNGKTIKSGKKVTKAGKYTLKVTDKVGNTKTVKFTIIKNKL